MSPRVFIYQRGEVAEVPEEGTPELLEMLALDNVAVSWTMLDDGGLHSNPSSTFEQATALLTRASDELGSDVCARTDATVVVMRFWCPHIRDHGIRTYADAIGWTDDDRQRLRRSPSTWFVDLAALDPHQQDTGKTADTVSLRE